MAHVLMEIYIYSCVCSAANLENTLFRLGLTPQACSDAAMQVLTLARPRTYIPCLIDLSINLSINLS